MPLVITAAIWSAGGKEDDKISADTAFGVINLTQGDQDISIVDAEHAKSLIDALTALSVSMNWEI